MSTPYRLEKKRSRFTVQVFASGVLRGFGHNPTIAIRDFSGTLDFDPQAPDKSSLQMTVKSSSLEVTDDIKKKDKQEIEEIMRKDVLEVSKYPEIKFESTGISAEEADDTTYRLKITGDLSLHGVTKQLAVDAQAKVRDDEARLTGEFRLDQSNYEIARVSALAGALKVKDQLQFTFDIKGFKE